jgi:hypothetical protein
MLVGATCGIARLLTSLEICFYKTMFDDSICGELIQECGVETDWQGAD